MKHILVTGTSRPWDETALRAARMVGRTLAERGFGLVTGNATGVDMAAADAFCTQVARQGCDLGGRYTQLALPYWRRGSFWPIPGYDARESRVALRGTQQWLEEAAARCAAVIMLGGHAGQEEECTGGGRSAAHRQSVHRGGKASLPDSLLRRRLGRSVPGGAETVVRESGPRAVSRPVPALGVAMDRGNRRVQSSSCSEPWRKSRTSSSRIVATTRRGRVAVYTAS